MSRLEQLRDRALEERSNNKYVKHTSVKVPQVVGEKVRVFRRDRKPGSSLGVYRCEATLKDADFKKVCALVRKFNTDLDAARLMTPDVKKVEVLSQQDGGMMVHRVDKLPFPFSNRDAHLYAIAVEEADGSLVIASTSAPGPKEKDGIVRSEVFIDTVIVSDAGNGTVTVFMALGINPNGNIPTAIMDAFIGDYALALGRLQKAAKKM